MTGQHNHEAEGAHNGCDSCRQRAIDSNALAAVASHALEHNGVDFVTLSMRYGVADAVLASEWLSQHDQQVARDAETRLLDEIEVALESSAGWRGSVLAVQELIAEHRKRATGAPDA